MYYEINVAKLVKTGREENYKHYFATAPRSIYTKDELINMLKHFVVLFPEPEYNISASRQLESGEILDVEQLLNTTKIN